jgi:hypothetical protein
MKHPPHHSAFAALELYCAARTHAFARRRPAMTWRFGLDLEYRFEVAVITVAWTALVVLGVMLALFFRLQPSEDSAPDKAGGPTASFD